MTRSTIGIAVVGVLAVSVGVWWAIHAWLPRDGTPDDRMLATMQHIAWEAQTSLDEIGELPSSLDELLAVRGSAGGDASEIGVSYHRLSATSFRLCGDFQRGSRGQTTARPFFDVIIHLEPEFRRARRAAGNHCYEISLQDMAPSVREDALQFRQMNAVATAAECTFSARGELPSTISEAMSLSDEQRNDPACRPRDFIGQPTEDPEYTRVDEAIIQLCAPFHRSYDPTNETARLFDPVRDARFAELAQPRPESGRRCYSIRMVLPDPPARPPRLTWDEPIEVETLPLSIRSAAVHDKRAIADIGRVLRLARCAFTMSGVTPSTIEGAVQTVALRPRVAERFRCGWAPHFFAVPRNSPHATYEPMDDGRVRVCAQFQEAWEQPLALSYYGEALANWPTSLPELQRPIPAPGRQCFTVRLTAIGSGAT